jgi:hypothetical protein
MFIMKKVVIRIGLLAALTASAVWVYQAPYRTAADIHAALKSNDPDGLSRHADFDAVRASLKEQIKRKLEKDVKDTPAGPLALLLADGLVNHLVDRYVTAPGLCQAISGKIELDKKSPNPPVPDQTELDRAFESASRGYKSPSRFQIVFRGKEGKDTTLVLTRNGLRWRLTGVMLPLGD